MLLDTSRVLAARICYCALFFVPFGSLAMNCATNAQEAQGKQGTRQQLFFTVLSGKTQPLSAKLLPDAACSLIDAVPTRTSRPLVFATDSEGYARFSVVAPDKPGPTAQLDIDCHTESQQAKFRPSITLRHQVVATMEDGSIG